MSLPLRLLPALAFGSLLLADAVHAQDPGALLITRFDSNDVVDVSAGGDLSAAPSFADGLAGPIGICQRPDGSVLATEADAGEVTDITGGGDLSLAVPFATGLGLPTHLVCTDSRVLVFNRTDGTVLDITAGGDFSAATPFAEGLPTALSLFEDSTGRLFVGANAGAIYDVTAGGDFSAALPFATSGGGIGGMVEFGAQLLAADFRGNRILDFSAGGDISTGPVFATLSDVVGLLVDVDRGELYASQNFSGGVFDASAGGDLSAASPFAFNLGTMTGNQMVRIQGCGDGVVQSNETCDDGNTVAGDGCGSTCALECFTDPIPAGCEPASPGDLLATAFNDQTVFEISSGGDFSDARPFALGVLAFGLCATPGGEILAAGDGVFDISRGGDFEAAPAFAEGLPEVVTGLWCDDSGVLAGLGNGEVFDITAGGDFAAATPFATLPGPVFGLARDDDGNLWSATSTGQLFDITSGGDFTLALPFADNGALPVGVDAFEGKLLVALNGANAVVDATAGGDLSLAPVFASVNVPGGLRAIDGLGTVFVPDISGSATRGWHEISAGGDFTAAVPFASGLDLGSLEDIVLVPGCGDGVLEDPEQCDDGNTDPGDGCDASCMFACTGAPQLGCVEAAKGTLQITETKVGKEKWKASLQKLADPTTQAGFGDPVAGTTRFDLCLYDDAGALVGSAVVDRAGDTCGPKAKDCWKAQSTKGWKYKDPDAASGGIKKLQLKSGDAGKGKVSFDGGNNPKKAQTSLETGVAGRLAGSTGATVQAVGSDGFCATLDADVQKDTGTQFKAKRK